MKRQTPRSLQFPLHLTIAILSLALILLAGGLIGGFGYQASREMLEATAVEWTKRIGRETLGELQGAVDPTEMAVSVLALDALSSAPTLAARMQRLPLLREMLANADAVAAFYVGYDSGDFFLVRRLPANDANAPAGAAFLVQSIERAAGRGRYIHVDAALATLRAAGDRPADRRLPGRRHGPTMVRPHRRIWS